MFFHLVLTTINLILLSAVHLTVFDSCSQITQIISRRECLLYICSFTICD